MVSVWVDSTGLRYMVSVCVDSSGCTIYGVSVGVFNVLFNICCKCGWIQLVVRYMLSVWVNSACCAIYDISVCWFNRLNDIWCQCGWIQLIQNTIQWTPFVNTGTKLRFALKVANLSNSWTSINSHILKRTPLHEFCYLIWFCGIHNTNGNKIVIFINVCLYCKFFFRFRNEHNIWTDQALSHVPRNTMESPLKILTNFLLKCSLIHIVF